MAKKGAKKRRALPITVLQYNVCWECLSPKKNLKNTHARRHCAGNQCTANMVRYVRTAQADLMGFQELDKKHMDPFQRTVKHWTWAHRARGNENAVLAYSRLRFRALGALYETGSKTAPCIRIFLAQRLLDLSTGKRFVFAVAHLHHGYAPRDAAAAFDAARKAMHAHGLPFVCCCDANMRFPKLRYGPYLLSNSASTCCVDSPTSSNFDQVFYTAPLRLKARDAGNKRSKLWKGLSHKHASDHYPIMARFS